MDRHIDAEGCGFGKTRTVRIDSDHPGARGFQKLHRQLPDHAETDDDDGFAERRREATDAL